MKKEPTIEDLWKLGFPRVKYINSMWDDPSKKIKYYSVPDQNLIIEWMGMSRFPGVIKDGNMPAAYSFHRAGAARYTTVLERYKLIRDNFDLLKAVLGWGGVDKKYFLYKLDHALYLIAVYYSTQGINTKGYIVERSIDADLPPELIGRIALIQVNEKNIQEYKRSKRGTRT